MPFSDVQYGDFKCAVPFWGCLFAEVRQLWEGASNTPRIVHPQPQLRTTILGRVPSRGPHQGTSPQTLKADIIALLTADASD